MELSTRLLRELQIAMNKKEPIFDNYPFWDAYKAVKNGEWTEEDFHQWAQSVWAEGADTQAEMEEELAN